MKTTVLATLLALSLAANAALYLQGGIAGNPSSTPSTAKAASNRSAPATTEATANLSAAAANSATKITQNLPRLQTVDLKALIVQLRAAGFSESMIRSIVNAQVWDQFAARRKALTAQQEDVPYWKSQQRFGFDPKTMSALRDLTREQNAQVKALLGPDGLIGNEERQFYQRRQFGDLPAEKIDQVQSIISDYADLRQDIYANANGVMLPEDREKLALLEKEQRTDLAGILTPQEIENYELRSSNTANQLRSQLGTFKPSEAEFLAIYRATRAAEEQYGSLTGGNQNSYKQIQTAVLEQSKTLLTPERYADLKQATAPNYQMVNRLVARLDLPASAATQVVAVQQDMAKRAAVLRADQSLSPEQRAIQVSGLLQEATTSLTNALGGTRGLEAYKQYGGQWLQSLQPRTVTPKG